MSRVVLLGGAVLACVLLAGMGTSIWQSREAELAAWQRNLSNQSLMLSEHALQSLRAADLVLKGIIERVQDIGIENDQVFRWAMGTYTVYEMIQGAASSVPQIDVVSIIALNGDIVNFTRSFPPAKINLADRDYFQAHMKDADLPVFVSVPVQSRGSGRWTFYLARKIRTNSGQIIGVAIAGVESNFFQDFYQATSIGPNSAVSLFRSDGMLLARYPARDHLLGTSFANATSFQSILTNADAGSVVTSQPRHADQTDRRLRIVSPRVVKEYPLVVNVTATEDLVLAEWRRWATATAIGTVGLVLVLAGLVVWISRLLVRQERADGQLRRHYGNLHALAEISALPSANAEDKLVSALRLGARHLGLELGIISHVGGEQCTVLHCCAPEGHDLQNGLTFPLGDAYSCITLQANDVVAIAHMKTSPHAGLPCYRAFGLEAYIGVPIMVRGQIFGTVSFSSATPYGRDFDGGDLEFMRLLGQWVGSMLEERRMTHELNRLATSDPLTGVWNRREFMRLANQEWVRATRYRRPLSVLMLDVDHFKRVNDTYGHAAGDTVLIRVAKVCIDGLREQDIFGRLGGEEFAAVLPEADLAGAMEVAERLRQRIAEVAVASAGGASIRVTASVGVALGRGTDISIEHLLQRADDALYRAKASGRNRVAPMDWDVEIEGQASAGGQSVSTPKVHP